MYHILFRMRPHFVACTHATLCVSSILILARIAMDSVYRVTFRSDMHPFVLHIWQI